MSLTPRTSGRAALVLLAVACALGLVLFAALQFSGGDEARVQESERLSLEPEGRRDAGRLGGGSVAGTSAQPSSAPSVGTEREAVDTSMLAAPPAPDAYSVFGVAVDELRGLPVAGAELALTLDDEQRSTVTAEDGSFRLGWPNEAAPQLVARAEGFVELRRAQVEPDTELQLRFAPAASIEVVAGGAMPIGDERGEVYVIELRLGYESRREPRHQSLDSAGRARFENLAPGEYFIWAHAPGTGVGLERVDLSEGEALVLPLKLPRAVALSGRVLETDRAIGLADVELVARPSVQGVWGQVEQLAEQRTRTDADGRYAFEALHPGLTRIELRPAWGTKQRRSVEMSGGLGRVERDFHLDPPAALAGIVLDAQGRPATGALVQVSVESTHERPGTPRDRGDEVGKRSRTQRSGPDGRFRFDSLPVGPRLHVFATSRADGHYDRDHFGEAVTKPRQLKLKASGELEEIELQLDPTGSVSGRVVDQDGEPVNGLEVRLYRSGWSGAWAVLTTDESGAFFAAGLIEGRYVLNVDHDDYVALKHEFEWHGSQPDEIELVLRRLGSLDVFVVDENGNAVRYISVNAFSEEEQEGEYIDSMGYVRTGRTDGYGRARIARLVAGEWKVSAHSRDYRMLGDPVALHIAGSERAQVELTMQHLPREERATLVGSVTTVGGGVPRRLRFVDRRGGSLSVEDGHFRLSGVRPGRASFVLQAEDCVMHRTEEMQLAPGGELDIGVIELQPASRLFVIVTGPDGKRMNAEARLIPLPEDKGGVGGKRRYTGRRQSRGRLSMTGVPRGAWTLRVQSEGHAVHRQRVELDDPQERVDVQLRKQ